MLTYGKLAEDTFNPITKRLIKLEMLELYDEIRTFNLRGIREEWSDVMCFLIVWSYFHVPLMRPILNVIPVIPGFGLYSARKFMRRMRTWNEIFAIHDLQILKVYLEDGSNFLRPEKLKKAFQNAGYSEEIQHGKIHRILHEHGWIG